MYIYKAQLVRVVSGDTIRCWIDLGFGVSLNSMPVKLLNIKAPTGIKGQKALNYLLEILPMKFTLKTKLDGNLIVADIMYGGEKSISEQMLESGLVEKYQPNGN